MALFVALTSLDVKSSSMGNPAKASASSMWPVKHITTASMTRWLIARIPSLQAYWLALHAMIWLHGGVHWRGGEARRGSEARRAARRCSEAMKRGGEARWRCE